VLTVHMRQSGYPAWVSWSAGPPVPCTHGIRRSGVPAVDADGQWRAVDHRQPEILLGYFVCLAEQSGVEDVDSVSKQRGQGRPPLGSLGRSSPANRAEDKPKGMDRVENGRPTGVEFAAKGRDMHLNEVATSEP